MNVGDSLPKALLVLDPQNDFFGEDNANVKAFLATIPVINSGISYFRDVQWPVIFVQHTSKRKLEGSELWKIHPAFDFQEHDKYVNKTDNNAFWKTELEDILKSFKVKSLIVCGYLSEYCVLSTLRGAEERGFQAAILDGAIASLEDRFTQLTLEISPTVSLESLKVNSELDC